MGQLGIWSWSRAWWRVNALESDPAAKKAEQCLRGLVSGYTTAIPFWLAPCWKKPFSAQLSGVHVRPERKKSTGTLWRGLRIACGGR